MSARKSRAAASSLSKVVHRTAAMGGRRHSKSRLVKTIISELKHINISQLEVIQHMIADNVKLAEKEVEIKTLDDTILYLRDYKSSNRLIWADGQSPSDLDEKLLHRITELQQRNDHLQTQVNLIEEENRKLYRKLTEHGS